MGAETDQNHSIAIVQLVTKDSGLPPHGENHGSSLGNVHESSGSLDLKTLRQVTNNFSDENKLGQGGFGHVYKGTLNGEEIAVKRLLKASNQGLKQLKNEVTLVSQLQHKNLVKVLGYAVEEDEALLV